MARFFHGFPWRWAVATIGDPAAPAITVLSLLDHIAADAAIDYQLGAPTQAQVKVPSSDPQVRIESDDGSPFLDEGTRVLLGYRREGITGTSDARWRCRSAGIIMQPTDAASNSAGAGNAYTVATAYDPRRLLYRRPVVDETGALPSADNGLKFLAVNPADIVQQLLLNTEAAHGPTLIDAHFGTLESIATISITFQRGITVGEAWDEIEQLGVCDIVLDPVHHPAFPGKISILNVYGLVGEERPDAVFAWDAPGRSLVDLSRITDGAQRVNKARYYNGQGGPPVALRTSPASIAAVGEYWVVVFHDSEPLAATVVKAAAEDVRTRKDGLITITVSPAPERSPIPLIDYGIGDRVPIAAKAIGFRKALTGTWRVTKIPLRITDAVEHVESLEVSTVDEVEL